MASSGANAEKRSWKDRPDWQKHLAWSVFFVVATGALFWYFVDFESSKDTRRSMNWIFATLYNLGGKYLACGVLLAAAIGYGALAWISYRKEHEVTAAEATAPQAPPATTD